MYTLGHFDQLVVAAEIVYGAVESDLETIPLGPLGKRNKLGSRDNDGFDRS